MKRHMAALAAAIGLCLPGSAWAMWNPTANGGKGCRVADPFHCYATEGYYGNPRQGGIASIKTDAANVQYNDPGFITHEIWQAFRNPPGSGGVSEGWVETGQMSDSAGYMHPFYAAQEAHTPFAFYIYEQEVPVPLGSWHDYLMLWDGARCYHVLWGQKGEPSSWTVAKTYCGFRAPEEIEAGIEVATEREPYSSGYTTLSIERNNAWGEWDGKGYVVFPGFNLTRIQGSLIHFGVCCGQAPWNGGAVTPASVAKRAGKTTASRTASMGGGETLYIYEGKYHLNVPTPMGNKAPKGTVLALLTSASGWIRGRYIGVLQPNVEEMRGPGWELH